MSHDERDDIARWLAAKPARSSSIAWERYEAERALLVQDSTALMALALGARLVEHLTTSRGCTLPVASIHHARLALDRALPSAVQGALDDEVQEVLRWLMEGPGVGQAPRGRLAESEMARLREGMPQRVALFDLAMSQEQDVEFEFLDTLDSADPDDPARTRWVVWVGRPLEVAQQGEHTLLVVRRDGARYEVPARHVRWLMPVRRKPEPPVPRRAPAARVLSFRGAGAEEE